MGGGGALVPGQQQRPYKHVDLMGLSAIRRVVDLADTEDSRDCFTLVCRTNQVQSSCQFTFTRLNSKGIQGISRTHHEGLLGVFSDCVVLLQEGNNGFFLLIF